VDTDDRAFKDPDHPFRVAIVCAMWLTGFDVECLSTLYIDKPMRAHNLMQAIARANRVYPGKVCGVIVDYNGVLRSLREALAQYATADGDDREDEGGDGGGEGGTDGGDETERLTVDLSAIDFERLRDEFARKVTRKRAAVQDIRDLIEQKLASMVARNPLRVDFYAKYQEIVAAYNREKDRATVEETFVQLVGFAATLDAEQRRAAEEGLSESELALFDLLFKETISKSDRERLKQASRSLLVSLRELLSPMHDVERITARFVEAAGVAPSEVHDDAHHQHGRELVSGYEQRRHRQRGHAAAHGFLDDAIDAAADEHDRAFDVDGQDRPREQHHAEDEPRRGLAYSLFRDGGERRFEVVTEGREKGRLQFGALTHPVRFLPLFDEGGPLSGRARRPGGLQSRKRLAAPTSSLRRKPRGNGGTGVRRSAGRSRTGCALHG
jgi:hypothetical protein